MDYGFGKTYRLPAGYENNNGCTQYYEVEFKNVDLVAAAPVDPKNPTEEEIAAHKEAQANLLRALEVLRTYGGQPIITKVEGKTIKFTLEQANVYGLGLKDGGKEQVSAKWDEGKVNSFADEAVEKIKALFANVKAVDGETSFEVKDATVDVVLM
jgi:hypothetical protein